MMSSGQDSVNKQVVAADGEERAREDEREVFPARAEEEQLKHSNKLINTTLN